MRLYCCLLLSLFACAAHAAAWTSDQPLRVPQPGTPTASVQSIAVDAAGGHRAVVQRSDGRVEILHFDAEQQLQSAVTRPQGNSVSAPAPDSKLVVLEDGSLYALADSRMLARLNVGGDAAWISRPQFNRCERAVGAPGSILWSVCRDSRGAGALQRTDAVGRFQFRQELPVGFFTALDPAGDGGVFFADNFSGLTSIGRKNADGSSRWFVSPSTLLDALVWAMLELENGHVLLVAQVLSSNKLRLMERDGQGQLVNQTEVELGFASREVLLARRESDGSLLLLLSRTVDGADALVSIRADRSLGWTHVLPAENEAHRTQLDRFALLRSEALETRLITRRTGMVNNQSRTEYRYFVVGADGQRRVELALGDNRQYQGFEPRPTQGDFLSAGRYARISAAGQVIDLTLPERYSGQEQPRVLAAYSDAAERYVVSDTVAGRTLQAWNRSGELRWVAPLQRDLPLSQLANTVAELQVAEQVLCSSTVDSLSNGERTGTQLECFARTDGTLLRRFDRVDLTGNHHLLLTGGVVARYARSAEGAITLRFNSVFDGSDVRPAIAIENFSALSRLDGRPGGSGVAYAVGDTTQVQWFDGRQPATASFPGSNVPAHVLADGLVREAQWYPRDGRPAQLIVPAGDLVLQVNDEGSPAVLLMKPQIGQTLSLVGFDPQQISVAWSTELSGVEPGFNDHVLARGSGAVHLLAAGGNDFALDLDIKVFERSTGQALDRRSVECAGGPCQFLLDGPVAGMGGLDLLALQQSDDGTRALRALHQAAPPATVRADQAGIAGLWYHPGLRGQGLVLTYVASSRTVFAPWFNYASSGRGWDESDLHWISLQGTAQPGAADVNLDLLLNSGGNFNAAPATAPEVIGEARLRLNSCDRASLTVRSELLPGTVDIPLVRLGPRTRPCVVTDGNVQAAVLSVADQGGFSIRQSGAWFDPATSGQGLMVEVVPAGPTQSGLLFAAWFTYDRANNADDEFAQDWFILQSDLANAQAGRVVVPIYRSIGGEMLRRATGNLFVVGEAELQFTSCTRLTVNYQFNDDALAGTHAGLSGQLDLSRIGGCSEN